VIYSFYHKDTGAIHPTKIGVNSVYGKQALELNTPADHVAIEGALDHLSQRVDLSGDAPRVVDYQPPQPSSDHEWNAQAKRWQIRPEMTERQQRRDAALAEIAQLEAFQARPLREAVLGLPGATERLKALDDQIAALRAQLTR